MKRAKFLKFFSGLSGKLLLWFLIISLTPLCITNWLSYQKAKDQLFHDTAVSLRDASILQTQVIRHNFSELQLDLEAEADRESTSQLMGRLIKAHQDSNKSVAEFVNSFGWAMLVEKYADDLKVFQYNYEYSDVLLIDTLGNILYNNARQGTLGKNLFKGELADTRLAATAKLALDSGRISFSDLEFYGPSKQLAGFMITPLLGEHGDKIGVIALQLSGSQLLGLVGQGTNFGKTGKRYLVGPDKTLRTPAALGDMFPVLERKIETKIVNKWRHDHVDHRARSLNEHERTQMLIYDCPDGHRVMGMRTDIEIAGVRWAYIAEIDEKEVFAASHNLAQLTVLMLVIVALIVVAVAIPLTRGIVKPILAISAGLVKVGEGNFSQQLKATGTYELGDLARGFNLMIQKLRQADENESTENWLRKGAKKLSDEMQGDQDLAELSRAIIGFLCKYLDAPIGAFYVAKDKTIELIGAYGFKPGKGFRNHFAFGEGIVGQAALGNQELTLNNIPEGYMSIASGLGETPPASIFIFPVKWNNQVVALLEFGTIEKFDDLHSKLLEMVSTSISTAVQTAISRDETKVLLTKTQDQAEELRVREEELRASNTTLENQTLVLKKSQAKLEERNEQLQSQQEELRVVNEELEERAQDLRDSRIALENKNLSLEGAKQELERKTQALEVSTKYKSEFLANISHELRTPLNSLLILAGMLAKNKEGNLTEEQVSYAKTVFDSGSDLLSLLNEILDLAKIESGKVDVASEPLYRDDFVLELQRKFSPMASNKGIEFIIEAGEAPVEWTCDGQKLGQILKNFLSNAFKFTNRGRVTLEIGPVPDNLKLQATGTCREQALAFTVTDTGIGIPEDKQQVIFEAFQQADGTTSRLYGGTGLGLSISRELTKLLGGEIHLQSEVNVGSSFILVIPLDAAPTIVASTEFSQPSVRPPVTKMNDVVAEVEDDRHELKAGERSVLIIEDDPRFVSIVADVARSQGFKVLIAENGRTGLQLAEYYVPSGIVLDIGLPDIDGWHIMERLKDSGKTRHIPVHFISAHDKSLDAMRNGAIGFLTKPASIDEVSEALNSINSIVERPVKKLLVIEDNQIQQESLRELIGNGDVETVTVETGRSALEALTEEEFDCIVLDLNLPDMNGLEILENMRACESLRKIPVVVYTGCDLEPKERATLDSLAQSIIVKDARSPERLLDDTALFLHRLEANLPEKQQRMIRMLHNSEKLFADRKVLLVDDDMRNIFSLSAVLQQKKMQVLTANNGAEALERLSENPDVSIVLMDIMMPVMDGYQAIRKIREQEQFVNLPIIALTAKAMKGDRALCIEFGASDYMTKPLYSEKLLSMMRVWLYR